MKKIYHRSIYTKNDAGNIFFMNLLLPAIIAMVILSIIGPVSFMMEGAMSEEASKIVIPLISISIAQGGMFLVYFLYNKILRMNPYKAGKISFKLNYKNIALAVLIGFVALFGLNNLINVFDALFQKMGHTPKPFPLPLNNGWWLAINIVLLAAVPAIVEELMFRGVIYNGLKQYGRKKAMIISAILFSLIHGNIDQTVYPILFGLILAYIVYRTDNIVYPMIAHFVNNCIVIVFNFIYEINPNAAQMPSIEETLKPSNIIVSVVIMLTSLAFIYFIGKLFKKAKQGSNLSLIDDIPETAITETMQALDNKKQNNSSPEGVDTKVWEQIICQKNDLHELEKSAKNGNTLLWVGLAISIISWLLSI